MLRENAMLLQAMELVNEVERNKYVPDSKTYCLSMNELLKTGQAKAVLTLYESASADPRTTALTDNNYVEQRPSPQREICVNTKRPSISWAACKPGVSSRVFGR